ncbi:MAG: asparagine synthase (glutamine-hydrolyzing) [Acidobacteria bacterium]|nr:asparagine synthase (glutamine-hydrolyzing) [Acidobacteriota bacterium]
MCGICGVIGRHHSSDIERMVSLLGHRGPDGRGVYSDRTDEPTGVSLGHSRLRIIDLSDDAAEPMPNEDETLWLVFNGEIYNFPELRERLQRRGHTFRSHCDAEVIIHLYEEKGPECVHQLDGMFAFAIWDSRERHLFLARDPLGIKPLYYQMDGGRLWFASEPRAIGRLTGADERIDPDAVLQYLTFLYVPFPGTAYRDIKKLAPGSWLLFRDGAASIHQFWKPSPTEVNVDERELAGEVRDRVYRAVSRQLISDVPLGAFLSGGVDSSAVVAAMAEHSDTSVRTFCIGFPNTHPSYDERAKARQVAELFDTDHREFAVSPDILDTLPAVVWSLGEPCADSSALLTYLISRETRQEVTVALTGIGGDELFAGYPRYAGARIHHRYQLAPMILRRALAALASRLLPDMETGSNTTGRARRLLEAGVLPGGKAYLEWVSFLPNEPLEEIFQPSFLASIDETDPYRHHAAILEELRDVEIGNRVSLLDLHTYLTDDLLFLADRLSMAHALELRVPFCDPDLVELATSLSMSQKAPGGRLKALLKTAMQGILPDNLLHQAKQGFMAPMSTWLRTDLRPVCERLLSPERVLERGILEPAFVQRLMDTHFSGRRDLSDRIYSLLVLEVWHEVHNLEQPPPLLGDLL